MNLKNILIVGLVGALIALLSLGLGLLVGGNNQSDQTLAGGTRLVHGISTDSTSPSTGEVRTATLTVTGATTIAGSLTVSATSTLAASQDGIMASASFTIATGTAKAVYTNSFGPMLCRGSDALLYVHDDAGTFAPSLVFAFGTTTSATGYSANILASTTVATTTSKFITPGSNLFILGSGESIVGAISDGTTGVASSTYFSRWSAQFDVPCNLIQ